MPPPVFGSAAATAASPPSLFSPAAPCASAAAKSTPAVAPPSFGMPKAAAPALQAATPPLRSPPAVAASAGASKRFTFTPSQGARDAPAASGDVLTSPTIYSFYKSKKSGIGNASSSPAVTAPPPAAPTAAPAPGGFSFGTGMPAPAGAGFTFGAGAPAQSPSFAFGQSGPAKVRRPPGPGD